MRNEIMAMRQLLSKYRAENEELNRQVQGNKHVVDKVDSVLGEMNEFRNFISKEHETQQEIVRKTENE
jgi:hypothetical protein